MAALVADAFKQVGQFHKADDDLTDRLNHRFTVILLFTFTAFVSAKQFIGEPISCWAPAQYSAPQVLYTNSICWLKGTYYLDQGERLIPHHTQNTEFRIAYYQFVPYILLLMAMLFYLPHMLWRNLSRYIGFDFRAIIHEMKTTARPERIDQVALQIHVALEYHSSKVLAYRYASFDRLLAICRCSHTRRNHLSLLYLFIKVLYTVNCLCQFYLLSVSLSFPFYTFGIDWLSKSLQNSRNRMTHESKWFPRTVMCEFMVRHLGSNQHWTATQCNLPINLFNELLFLIIWAWLVCLSSLTCLSLVSYIFSSYTQRTHTVILKYLHMNEPSAELEERKRFIRNYLRSDGLLALRIIAQNTNDIVMANLVGALFNIYLKSLRVVERTNDADAESESHGLYSRIEQ